ncbi:MAG: hypothetical protein GC159_03985 [Phycisphaera sp.]|nr:hypothetical protein [Phycisphaera sp.]
MTTTAPTPDTDTLTADERTFLQRLRRTPLRDLLRGRVSGALDYRQVIDAADLPDSVAAVIHRVAGRRGLTRWERVDVARELIAHFADGLDAGADPDELVAVFGDVDAAAKLIVRAKRRGRSWPYKLIARGAQAFGVLVLLYIVAIGYYAMGEPKIAVNYVAKLNAPLQGVPADQLAWPEYRKAFLAWSDYRDAEAGKYDDSNATFDQALSAKPGDEHWDAAMAMVERNARVIELLRHASTRDRYGYVMRGDGVSPEDHELWPDKDVATGEDHSMLIEVLLNDIMPMRNASNLLRLDALRAARAGDGRTVALDVETILNMVRHVSEPSILICDLVGMAMCDQALGVVSDTLQRTPEVLSDDQLRRLAHVISDRARVEIDMTGERMMFYDIIQRMYTDNGHGDGHLTPKAMQMMALVDALGATQDGPRGPYITATAAMPLANMVVASRRDMVDKYEQLMGQTESMIRRPLWETIDDADPIDAYVDANHSTLERARYALIWVLIPALSVLDRAEETAIGRTDGVLVGIAMEIYHRREHAWPASLDQLTPTLLPGVPRDRFTGRPLLYRLVDGMPVVYSVGADRDDDGGAAPADTPENREQFGDRLDQWASPRELNRNEPVDGDWVLWHAKP